MSTPHTPEELLRAALQRIVNMLGYSDAAAINTILHYPREDCLGRTRGAGSRPNYDSVLSDITAARLLAFGAGNSVLCPNCYQSTIVNADGKFTAHIQGQFPCPESGKDAPPEGWEKE